MQVVFRLVSCLLIIATVQERDASAQPPAPVSPPTVETEPPSPALSAEQAKPQAQAHHRNAEAAYRAGNLEQALTEDKAAFRLDPHPVLARSLVKLYEKLSFWDEGLAFIEELLAARPPEAEAAFLREAKERFLARQAADRAKLPGRAALTTIPTGARVLLDGKESCIAPCEVPAKPVKHRIGAELAGYQPTQREVMLRAGLTEKVEFMLTPMPPEGVTASHERPWWPWAVGGVALAAAAGGAGFGLAARSAAADRDGATTGPAFNSAQEDAELRAQMATGLLITAGVAAAVAGIGYLLTGE